MSPCADISVDTGTAFSLLFLLFPVREVEPLSDSIWSVVITDGTCRGKGLTLPLGVADGLPMNKHQLR